MRHNKNGETTKKEHASQRVLAPLQKATEGTREGIKMMRDTRNLRRRVWKRQFRRLDPREQAQLHHTLLAIEEIQFERKQRKRLLQLSRKNKKQADAWVV